MITFCAKAIMTPTSEASMGFRLPAHLAWRARAGVAEAREQHVAERAVHRLGHELREQRAGRADHRAGDDHRGVVEHEALEGDRQPGERVVERDHDRHVGAADRQRHGEPEHEREREECVTTAGRGVECAATSAPSTRRGEQQQIQNLLPAEAQAALDQALQLAEGDGAAAEGDRTDDAADHREGAMAHARISPRYSSTAAIAAAAPPPMPL
jgi:hypothetical protein